MNLKSALLKRGRRAAALSFSLLTAVAVAQNPPASVCSTLVQEALNAANAACSATTRNHVCLGNDQGAATPADGVTDLVFESVGDIAGVAQIKALQLSPLDEIEEHWGVALMQLQANLPDTLPGQNVTFLMFGDTAIEDATGEQARVEGQAVQPSNLRLGPATTSPILGSVPAGAAVVATGKAVNASGELWVRLRYEEYRTLTGWMLASLLDIDLDALPEVASNSLTFNPMQAFYFRTGIGQTQCVSAPANGVLVQTPQGAGRVSFNVNGIEVALGSTVFLSAPESGGFTRTCFSLLSGDMDLKAGGAFQNLNPGERSCAPLNEDGQTSGPPGPPEPFDPVEIGSLALLVELLPDEVEIPDPAPRRTATPLPTAVPIAPPTSIPAAPAFVPPAPTSGPTAVLTPVPTAGRFVNATSSRSGTTVSVSASAGPDAPASYNWQWSDVFAQGPSASFSMFPDISYLITLVVCWPDEECLTRDLTGAIPPCPIDFNQSTTITLNFTGGGQEYEVRKTLEDCSRTVAGNFGMSAPTFSSAAHVGETFEVYELPQPGILVASFFVADTSPINASLPGLRTAAPQRQRAER